MKFIIITLLVIFIFGKLFKYAFKYWVMSALQKAQNQGFDTNKDQKQARKEGSIHVETTPKKDINQNGKNGGEYIDYEVVK